MKRRGNHEGGVPRQRADGRWQAMYTGADGRRRSVIARTPTDGRAKLRAALRLVEDGQAPPSGRLTVSAWLDDWLTSYVAGGVNPKAPRTVELYESVVRVHLKPQLGRIVLAKLTREQVAKALAVIGQTLAPSSASRVYVILGAAPRRGREVRPDPSEPGLQTAGTVIRADRACDLDIGRDQRLPRRDEGRSARAALYLRDCDWTPPG